MGYSDSVREPCGWVELYRFWGREKIDIGRSSCRLSGRRGIVASAFVPISCGTLENIATQPGGKPTSFGGRGDEPIGDSLWRVRERSRIFCE